jgi:hypothetical protein
MIEVPLAIEDSFLLICPQCFDCWARLVGSDQSHWWHRYVPCLAHTKECEAYGSKLGGSLLEADSKITLDLLPPALIDHECRLLLQETQ